MNKAIAVLVMVLAIVAVGQERIKPGSIEGRVVDQATRAPLIGANIIVKNSVLGAISDADGGFVIPRVPVGSYTLECRYLGYEPQVVADVIVRPGRRTAAAIAMKISALSSAEVTVRAGYFPGEAEHPLSIAAFSFEEIRRAPEAAGDISRIILGLPSLAKINDQSNALIVRGGSPLENAFYIDNIPVPNINHFPVQGATAGPMGMVQVDFIEEAKFHAGGFSAAYGDRLSSVLDISFREGNRKEIDAQLDLSFVGFGGAVEGPLPGGKGAWLFAARRSYFDLVVKTFDVGTTAAPWWGDYQGKMVWDLSPRHRLSALFLCGDDHNNPDHQAAVDNKMLYYGVQDLGQATAGVNWRALWGRRGFSNTTFSGTHSRFRENLFDTNSNLALLRNRSDEYDINLEHKTHLRMSDRFSLQVGLQAHRLESRYDNFYSPSFDVLGDSTAALSVTNTWTSHKIGGFVNGVISPRPAWSITLGVRHDYFTANRQHTWSPRTTLAWQIDPLTRISVAAGWYHQNLPVLLLAQSSGHRALLDPRALHTVIGVERLVTENTRFSLELYDKRYDRFPVDPGQPSLFVVDELFYGNGFFAAHQELISAGTARSRGVEVMVQKKLAQKFYGLVSAACFRSRFQDGAGRWQDRLYDNRFLLSLQGGYKPAHTMEWSARWIYAGGSPYTPVDAAASAAAGRTVLDAGRLNGLRYPAYHSLNLRVDRRFTFTRSNLVAYLSVWNAYNRKNIAVWFWNEAKRKVDVIYQYTALPVIGLEYEF